MFYDLNVAWSPTTSAGDLRRTVAFSAELGYSALALNHVLEGTIPAKIEVPIPLLPPTDLPEGLSVLRRCTVIFADTGTNYRLSALAAAYDLVALRPVNEKAFLAACTSVQEHGLISLDLTQRFPFHFRPKPLMAAVNRGIRFEICYAQATLGDAAARRNFISNAMGIFRATRGRGIVLSSGTVQALGLRAPADVVNLVQVWGLARDRAMEALDSIPRSVIVNERLKRTSFRGVCNVVDGGVKAVKPDQEAPAQTLPRDDGQKKPTGGKRTANDPPVISKRAAKRLKAAAKQVKGDDVVAVEAG